MAQNSPEEQFILAANDWDLERLYKDLAVAKREVAPHKRELTEVEKLHLRGLLCDCSPSDIAKKLHKQEGGLRAELSETVYRYVKQLTKEKVDIRLNNWRDIPDRLEKAGYKTRSSNSVENKSEITPSVSESDIDDLLERVRSHSPIYAADFDELGRNKAKERDFEGAIKNFDRAIKINPDYADAYNNRATVRQELGDDAGAFEDCTNAILLKPNCPYVHNNRGIIYCKLGDYRGAQADHTRAIQLNPRYAQAYKGRGFARLRLGDLQGALKDFTQAIELNPNDALAWNNRGDVYLWELDDLPRALEDYIKAARLNPNNATTFYNLGVIHSRLGNKEKALEDFTKAIQLERGFAQAYLNRGIVHYELGYSQKADVDFHNAKNLYLVQGKEENYQKVLNLIEKLQQED
jgi:tetratricopeptide (TPR) repeat protein